MLRCGLALDGNLLALASASHSGEEFHVAGARSILAGAGLTEADLQCPPDLPLDDAARIAWLRAGGVADRIHMNCSGKHAAMLATCVAAGWPTATYRDPGHPLQVRIRQAVEGLSGEPVAAIGGRRVRCAAVLDLDDRTRQGLPCARAGRDRFAGAAGRRRDAR